MSAARDVIADATTTTPVAVTGLADATAIALGASHACALRRDGTVACWGAGSAGELGDGRLGPGESSDRPVAVPGLTGVVELAAGARVTCARTTDAVWCWGTLEDGYSRVHARPTPTRIDGLASPVELAASATTACARTATGDVRCWDHRWTAEPAPVTGAAQLAAGPTHVCARLDAGTVRCWGDDALGQLGPRDPATGTVKGIDTVIDVAAGGRHTCVIRAAD